MNECEKIHPMLPDYLREKLSMTERRWVARHLNHCAEARRLLDEIKSGTRRKPAVETPARMSWDERILGWMGGSPKKKTGSSTSVKRDSAVSSQPAIKKKIRIIETIAMIILVFPFSLLVVLIPARYWSPVLQIPFVQRELKGLQALEVEVKTEWLHESPQVAGWNPQTTAHWEGAAGPAAEDQQILVSDEDHWAVYWQLIQPGVPEPAVDFTQNAVVLLFQGQKSTTGFSVKLQKITDEGGSTGFYYQEKQPGIFSIVKAQTTSPWDAVVVPRPTQTVVFKKN
jgi:hypothetical protein